MHQEKIMSEPLPHEKANTAALSKDERLQSASPMQRLLSRPELGAVSGLILITVFFVSVANPAMFTAAGIMNFMAPASQLGILAVAAALLMIGALVVWQVPLGVAIIVTLLFAAFVGMVNAQIVIRTGLPSFIVTLAFLFILRGLSLVGLKWATGGATQLRGVKEAVAGSYLAGLFSGDAFQGLFAWMAENDLIDKFPNGEPSVKGVPVEVLWFIAIALIATYVLVRTRFGNWIFAAGGDALAARLSVASRQRYSCARQWLRHWWLFLPFWMPVQPMRAVASRRSSRRLSLQSLAAVC